jgi:broad specificity phosphatase PhoE
MHANSDDFQERVPMTTRLLLISHAATAAMRSGRFPADGPLDGFDFASDLQNVRHKAALEALRERLSAYGEALVFSSPAACARETAEALGLAAQMEVGLDDMDYGRWRGQRLMDVSTAEADALAQWSSDPAAAPHGGESFSAVLARVGGWLDGLYHSGTVIAVTHAPVIRAAIIHALNAPPASFTRIEVAPLSVVELRRSVQGWRWWPGQP